MSTQTAPISVCQSLPRPVRYIMGVAGAFAIGVTVHELGPVVLWPFSVLSLFFGFLLLGGVSVGGAFLTTALFNPDVRWDILPGRLVISATYRNQSHTITLLSRDLTEVEIVDETDTDGPPLYRLACELRFPDEVMRGLDQSPFHRLVRLGIWKLLKHTKRAGIRTTSIHSPVFAKRERAEQARQALLRLS